MRPNSEAELEPAVAAERAAKPGMSKRIAKDIATVAAGTFFSGLFGVLQVFVVPRIVGISDYGYFRMFILYIGYVGLLHCGFCDGLLLRWAGKDVAEHRNEVFAGWKFLLLQHLAIVVPATVVVAGFFAHTQAALLIAISVLVYAFLFNSVTLFQFAFQASRRFVPVAFTMSMGTGIFVTLVYVLHFRHIPNYVELIGYYFVGWGVVLLYLLAQMRRVPAGTQRVPVREFGLAQIAIGWPIVLSNIGFGLAQCGDRLVMSAFASLYEFAQYSLASSTIFVPITIVLAISRVMLPHFATLAKEERSQAYRAASRLVVLSWAMLVPYYFVVSWVVDKWLQKYQPSLPIAAVLVISVLPFAIVQILQSNLFNLLGRQLEYFASAAIAVLLIFASAISAVKLFHSPRAVAACEVVVATAWWMVNSRRLDEVSGEGWAERLKALTVMALSAGTLFGCMKIPNPLLAGLAYYTVIALPIILVFRNEFQLMVSVARRTLKNVSADSLAISPREEIGD